MSEQDELAELLWALVAALRRCRYSELTAFQVLGTGGENGRAASSTLDSCFMALGAVAAKVAERREQAALADLDRDMVVIDPDEPELWPGD